MISAGRVTGCVCAPVLSMPFPSGRCRSATSPTGEERMIAMGGPDLLEPRVCGLHASGSRQCHPCRAGRSPGPSMVLGRAARKSTCGSTMLKRGARPPSRRSRTRARSYCGLRRSVGTASHGSRRRAWAKPCTWSSMNSTQARNCVSPSPGRRSTASCRRVGMVLCLVTRVYRQIRLEFCSGDANGSLIAEGVQTGFQGHYGSWHPYGARDFYDFESRQCDSASEAAEARGGSRKLVYWREFVDRRRRGGQVGQPTTSSTET